MFDRIQTYHFVLKNGREFVGRVIDQDDQKIVVEPSPSRLPLQRVILYHASMMLAEPLGWKGLSAQPGQ